MKKIYVAGKFEDKDLVREIYRKLEEKGYEVSYDWTLHENIKPYTENKDKAEEYAMNEVRGISLSDVIIYLSNEAGHTLHMEFGAAVMCAQLSGKPKIFAVGEHNANSPWFFNPSVTRCNSIEEVLEQL